MVIIDGINYRKYIQPLNHQDVCLINYYDFTFAWSLSYGLSKLAKNYSIFNKVKQKINTRYEIFGTQGLLKHTTLCTLNFIIIKLCTWRETSGSVSCNHKSIPLGFRKPVTTDMNRFWNNKLSLHYLHRKGYKTIRNSSLQIPKTSDLPSGHFVKMFCELFFSTDELSSTP